MLPLTSDLTLWRGSTPPITTVLGFKDDATGFVSPAKLAGATVLLTINWVGGGLSKSSADGSLTVDTAGATVLWRPTRAETLSFPPGRIATYTYETITANGDREPYLTGYIVAIGEGMPLPLQVDAPQVVQVVLRGLQGEPGPSGGPPGPKGDTGSTGPAGPKGDQGNAGAAGPTGPAGPKGDTGAIGPVGPAGAKGDTGNIGAAGPKGDTGAVGPAGPKGDTGATGPSPALPDWAAAPLTARVHYAVFAAFPNIAGASWPDFVARFAGDRDGTDGAYTAVFVQANAPTNGKFWGLLSAYLQAAPVGRSSTQANSDLTAIWAAAPSIAL